MATCAQYQSWLDAAEAAWHDLMTSGNTVLVRYGEKEVRYTKADEPGLRRYIAYLRKMISQCNEQKRRRVMHITPIQ